jgi:exodeoxyribonuclease III
MLRIISLNLNGIRSAYSKGVLPWIAAQNADVVCLQELKAQYGDLTDEMKNPAGLHAYYHCAEKKGYSGVGLWCRQKPDAVIEGTGNAEFDAEARYLRADFGRLSVISLYLPSGSSSPERQEAKFRFMAVFYPHLVELAKSKRDVVVCGDWNIAHREIDLRNWKNNRKNSGQSCPGRRRLARRVSYLASGNGRRVLHLVVKSRSGVGQERWLAAGLSNCDSSSRRYRSCGHRLQGTTVFRSRAADDRLRACVVFRIQDTRND